MSNMFENNLSLKKIDFNLDTNKTNNFSYMFYNCESLTNLNFSNCNTKAVKDMSYMFYNCKSLEILDIKN